MRIVGWLLLIIGSLLCVSIVWAAIGFLMMGLGLVCLLIAEQARKRAPAPAQPSSVAREPRFAPVEPRPVPAPLPKPAAALVSRAAAVAAAVEKVRGNNSSYDAEKWNAVVESDPDIARLVEALAPYGRQYVNELAAVYLVLNDKNYLPDIVDETVASARRTANQKRAQDVTVNASGAGGPDRNAGSRSNRSRELLRAAGVASEPVTVDPAATAADTGPEPAGPAADSAPVAATVPAISEPEPAPTEAATAETAAPLPVPGVEAFRKADHDDANDLRDLFKQLGSA